MCAVDGDVRMLNDFFEKIGDRCQALPLILGDFAWEREDDGDDVGVTAGVGDVSGVGVGEISVGVGEDVGGGEGLEML